MSLLKRIIINIFHQVSRSFKNVSYTSTFLAFIGGMLFQILLIKMRFGNIYQGSLAAMQSIPLQNRFQNVTNLYKTDIVTTTRILNNIKHLRIFCWVLTNPTNHKSKAQHVKASWLRRCDNYVFTSTIDDPDLPAVDIKLPAKDTRDYLWGKYKLSMEYLYDHYIDQYDFFLKADDDTYFIMENVRKMLQGAKSSDLSVWGRRFKPYSTKGYVSGGAGYIMTNEVVKLFVTKGMHNGNRTDLNNGLCPKGLTGSGDVNFGFCMNSLNINYMDTRDLDGRELFYPFDVSTHVNAQFIPWTTEWLNHYDFYPHVTYNKTVIIKTMSNTPVSFHYIDSRTMYLLDYLIYNVTYYKLL